MVMMTLPLLVLYEVGVAGAALVYRRRKHAAIAGLILARPRTRGHAGAGPGPGQAKARADSRRFPAHARGFPPGLHPNPRRPGPGLRDSSPPRSADRSVPELCSTGFSGERPAQAARLSGHPLSGRLRHRVRAEERVLLQGEALTERLGSMLEADTITYQRNSCVLDAHGQPHLFDRDQVLIGEGIRYDTCRRRGIVEDAFTNFTEGSTVWFLRGNVAQDSSSSRIYAGSSEITSCDLPTPHYHFSAGEMKWISKSVLVARPVVLYVRDVPILWLPFIFQDVRPGRHSGILVPQFGLNDLVRPTRTYNRQITNIGYYWAPNDYIDLTARLDWFANRYVQYGMAGQYRWLNRFITGSAAFNEQRQVGWGLGPDAEVGPPAGVQSLDEPQLQPQLREQ